MSAPADLTIAPFYAIRAVAADGKALAGVGRILPTVQFVHINSDIHIWGITKVGGPGVYRLSLRDSYRYTGVTDEKVIASVEQSDDREWLFRSWPEHHAFSIEVYPETLPHRAWTLIPETGEIVIRPYEVEPSKYQLFKLEPFVG